MCGEEADKYNLGGCQLRWTYLLALIAVIDVLVLTVLGYVLAYKQVKMLPKYHFTGECVNSILVLRGSIALLFLNARNCCFL